MHVRSLALGVVCLFSAAEVGAGGFSVTTFGARRTGMLANLASPDNATALFHNPAGLADQDGLRLHVSGSVAFLQTQFELQALDQERFPELTEGCDTAASCTYGVDAQGYYDRPIEPLSTKGFLPYVGVSQDLGVVSSALDDVVVSAAITAPNLYAGRLPASGPSSYFFVEGHFLVISSITGVGWRINDKLAIGGNVMYNYMRLSYARRFSMSDVLRGREPTAQSVIDADFAQAALGDVRMDYDGFDDGVGWTLSALYTPTDWLSLGLTYSDATDARFRGDVGIEPVREDVTSTNFQKTVRGFGYKMPNSLLVEMPIPASLSGGANVRLSSRVEVGADFRLWFYNVYETQVVEPIYDSSEGQAPLTREQMSSDKDYSVSYDVSVGTLVKPVRSVPELEILAGVGFDKSPVPDRYFSIDNPSMDNYRFAAGVRWNGHKGLRVSFTYTEFGYLGRDVTNSETRPALNVRGRGRNRAPRLEMEYLF